MKGKINLSIAETSEPMLLAVLETSSIRHPLDIGSDHSEQKNLIFRLRNTNYAAR